MPSTDHATEDTAPDDQHSAEPRVTRIVTDYSQYDFRRLEGDDTELSELDFLPTAARPKQSAIYQPPRRESAWFALAFMALALLLSSLSWQGYITESLAVSQVGLFEQGKWWQSLSALFMHADIVHLISNGWLLVLFGWILKDFGTSFAFPLLALVVGVVTNIATVMTMPAQHQLVGASGMVYGMVAMWIVFYMYYSESSLKDKWMGSLAFFLVVMFPDTFNPQVSYAAHAIGFGIGILAGLGYCALNPKR